jgi:hypothetical protein
MYKDFGQVYQKNYIQSLEHNTFNSGTSKLLFLYNLHSLNFDLPVFKKKWLAVFQNDRDHIYLSWPHLKLTD